MRHVTICLVPCGHLICGNCINRLIQKAPHCRTKIILIKRKTRKATRRRKTETTTRVQKKKTKRRSREIGGIESGRRTEIGGIESGRQFEKKHKKLIKSQLGKFDKFYQETARSRFMEEKNEEAEKFNCKICYLNSVSVFYNPCGHTLCDSCIVNWKENTCPFCRQVINEKKSLFF